MNKREDIASLLPAERQQRILEFLKKEFTARGSHLSELLGVSEMTIRRDLDVLEQQGLVERTHGGAVFRQERVAGKFHYQNSTEVNPREKRAIAKCAAAMIEPHDIIYIGEGVTASQVVRYVEPGMPFTIFTNNLGVISETGDMVAELILLAGRYDAATYALNTTTEGFDLLAVQDLSPRIASGQPVLPQATLELVLPLSATVTSLVFTSTQDVALPNLDIPSVILGVGLPDGPTGSYTNTVDGVYPVTATFESSALDTYQLIRIHVIPVTYDATNDQATLYRTVDIAVAYDTPETIGLTSFEPDELQYLPGETLSTTTQVLNAGDTTETVTATLVLQDSAGQLVGFQGSVPFNVPAGGTYELELGWTGSLDGDVYLARIFIWKGGQVVAGAGAGVSVTAGEVSALTAPDLLMPGVEGSFEVTFDNLGANTSVALASLAIYDTDDALVAFLPSQATAVAGGGSATLSFQWTPDEPGNYTASLLLTAGGQEYGPLSQSFEVGYRVYLPLILRNY